MANQLVWVFVAVAMVKLSIQQDHDGLQDSLDVFYKINESITVCCQTCIGDSGQNFNSSYYVHREFYSAFFKRLGRKSQAEKFAQVKLWPYVVMAISSLWLFI